MSSINKGKALKQLKRLPEYLHDYCNELTIIEENNEEYDRDYVEKLKSVVIIDFMLIENIKYEIFSKENFKKLKNYKKKLMSDFLTREEITQIEKIIKETVDNYANVG